MDAADRIDDRQNTDDINTGELSLTEDEILVLLTAIERAVETVTIDYNNLKSHIRNLENTPKDFLTPALTESLEKARELIGALQIFTKVSHKLTKDLEELHLYLTKDPVTKIILPNQNGSLPRRPIITG